MALAADGRRSAGVRGVPGMADRGFQARIRDWQNGQVFHEERTLLVPTGFLKRACGAAQAMERAKCEFPANAVGEAKRVF
jgi:hypothetical protein